MAFWVYHSISALRLHTKSIDAIEHDQVTHNIPHDLFVYPPHWVARLQGRRFEMGLAIKIVCDRPTM